MTELFRGFADPSPNGLVETTTPPETGVGPEGMLPERWLAVTSMPLAPRSAMPIPENATLPSSITSWALSGVVLDRVGFHLEAAHGFALEGLEEHASAVVVDRVSGEGASFSVGDADAPRAARDAVADDLGVVVGPFRPEDGDARITGAAYVVGEDLGAGRVEDNRADEGAVRDVVGDDLGAGRIDDEHAEVVVREIVARDGGVGALLEKIPLLELPSTSFPEMLTSRELFEAYRVLTGVSHDVGE